MVNLLPAVLIGGPPNAGKSVLIYSLTKALRQRGIEHHAILASPDGNGPWTHESEQEQIRLLRVYAKSPWSDDFVRGICQDISRRLLPMLIDAGGRPQGEQIRILQNCTHSLLLLREDKPESKNFWKALVEETGLLPLATLTSDLHGSPQVTQREAVLMGTLTGLERGRRAEGELFELLVDRLASLFSSYSVSELEHNYLTQAPSELALRLAPLLQTLEPGASEWEPRMLPKLLAYLPANVPLSVYGRGPHWLYCALALHTGSQDFYQFDPRQPKENAFWIAPPLLRSGEPDHPEVEVQVYGEERYSKLSISIKIKHLDYLQTNGLPFPELPVEKGIVLDGAIPSWLATALVRFYADKGHPWLACYQPLLKGAVVVAAHNEEIPVGAVVPMQ